MSNKVIKKPKVKLKATFDDRPLPVVAFDYPEHGNGENTPRYVRVTEMDNTHLRGFEIEDEFDEDPGVYKTYSLDKVGNDGVLLLHLSAPEE